VKCEVVAIGSELLLGGSVDTNSAWIGQRLAEHGIDSHFHATVGDNVERIEAVLRASLERSDAVIVTGGLGPTQDDVTRDAVARLMSVELVESQEQCDKIAAIFAARGREMPQNNRRQALVPIGATLIEQRMGTAPGLICPVGDKVVYLLPGVPFEMKEMADRAVFPDITRRSGVRRSIVSRTIKTWGLTESRLAEMLDDRFIELESSGGAVTLAFLAHGIDGIHVRVSASAETPEAGHDLIQEEESRLRVLLGSHIFGVDEETMELAVSSLLLKSQLSLGTAESLTGGLIASRLTEVPGGSAWFKGSVVSYASEVKRNVLKVPDGPVVSTDAAVAMAEGARGVLGCDVAVAVTGVAGPTTQEDKPVGLVYCALAGPWGETQVREMKLVGDRRRIREHACINALDFVRSTLVSLG
jgi:nicotinamide-nucleotide amidase